MTEIPESPEIKPDPNSLADRLERWIATDLPEILSVLRQPAPLIRCGHSHRDPRTEDRIQVARATLGITPSPEGCARLLVLWEGYRCVECGRWFHRACIQAHFLQHREPESGS